MKDKGNAIIYTNESLKPGIKKKEAKRKKDIETKDSSPLL